MVSAADIVGLLVILGINAGITALATRFLRVRLHTDWGSALYTLLLIPLPLVATTLLLSGVLRLGPNLGSATTVFVVVVVLPMAVGIAFDFFWMPAPEEVDVPDTQGQRAR